MSEQKPWEKMTLSEQMSAARDRQASFRLEAEVRKAARERNLDVKEVEELAQRARQEFVMVNGEAQAVDAKRQAVRNGRGGLVTVEEWMDKVRTVLTGWRAEGNGSFPLLPALRAIYERML